MFGRRGASPRVFAARGQRIFEAAAGTRDTGARLPAGARALRDGREAPYQQPSRTPLHKVLRGPPDGASGTSTGSKNAVVHVCTPCRCGRATTWSLAAQIPRHVCTCENVLWVGGRWPPFFRAVWLTRCAHVAQAQDVCRGLFSNVVLAVGYFAWRPRTSVGIMCSMLGGDRVLWRVFFCLGWMHVGPPCCIGAAAISCIC